MLWWLSKSLYDEVVMAVLIWCVDVQIQEGISTVSVTSSWRDALNDLDDELEDLDDDE